MKISDIEYPLRLCVELLYYAGFGGNGKTEKMTVSQIKQAMSIFFDDSQIEKAIKILTSEDEE